MKIRFVKGLIGIIGALCLMTGCEKAKDYSTDLSEVSVFDFSMTPEDILTYEMETYGNGLETEEITKTGYYRMAFANEDHKYLFRLDEGTLCSVTYSDEAADDLRNYFGTPHEKSKDKFQDEFWYGVIDEIKTEVRYELDYFTISREDNDAYRKAYEAGEIEEVLTLRESGEKEEIRFWDLPWGCSVTEAKESGKLDDLQIAWEEVLDADFLISAGSLLSPDNSVEKLELVEDAPLALQALYVRMLNRTGVEVEVAGYVIAQIELLFAKAAEDGYLSSSEDDAVFYGAEYFFKDDFTPEMFEDLKQKMISVYGTISKQKFDSRGKGYCSWYGANDTVVKLEYTSLDTVYINYVWLKGDEYLQKANEVAATEKKNADEQERANVTGL